MAWWQKKILRYALSRTGLLDEKALDLDNLDITLGKSNIIELKDVALSIKRISAIAQLPPSLRIERARVVSLRLTVPADIYQSSIVAEVDGVELAVKLENSHEADAKEQARRSRSSTTSRIPQHRKVHRRIHSPTPSGGRRESDPEEAYLPMTEELAKSFLLEEPLQGRRALEASVVASDKALEESIVSESSEGNDLGTGPAMGLPGFLADFLQGIVDRFQVVVKNVDARLETELPGDGSPPVPITIRLCVDSVELARSSSYAGSATIGQDEPGRRVTFSGIALDVLSDAAIFAELSQLPSPALPAESAQRDLSPVTTKSSGIDRTFSPLTKSASASTHRSPQSSRGSARAQSSPIAASSMSASIMTADDDRFADAGEDESARPSHPELEIQAGDDNISWGSRRSQSDAPVEDLWESMVSEDNLPQSLLLDRAPTPRFRPSRNPSPTISRKPTDLSFYQSSFQSPGSWPTLDSSREQLLFGQHPGSWPNYEEPQLNSLHASELREQAPVGQRVDNKHTALTSGESEPRGSKSILDEPMESPDDLSASRLFTHEEAESMYMSAMSHSVSMHVPGGWGSEGAPSEKSSSPEVLRPLPANRPTEAKVEQYAFDEDLAYGEQPYSTPGNVTPRAASPSPPKSPPRTMPAETARQSSRTLLQIDFVHLTLPTSSTAEQEDSHVELTTSIPNMGLSQAALPGTFSAYSEKSASRRQPLNAREQDSEESFPIVPRASTHTAEYSPPIGVVIGAIKLQFDMSCGRLLYRLMSQSLAIFTAPATSPHSKSNVEDSTKSKALTLSISEIGIAFREATASRLHKTQVLEPSDNLLTLCCQDIVISSDPNGTDVRLGKFALFLGSSCLLSFDRSVNPTSSVNLSEQRPDVVFSYTNRKSPSPRSVSEIIVDTLPVHILFDLPLIDEILETFGGLSGLLEAGNSILSDSGMGSPSLRPSEAPKGVRFEDHQEPLSGHNEYKANARVAGVGVVLKGSKCSIELWTTTVRAIYREQGTVARMDRLSLTLPQMDDNDERTVLMELSSLRLEYLLNPVNSDLERLLSLITPSKDKYDDDDDILVDTLLRQRRKGAVARISASQLDIRVDDWKITDSISALAEELSKLSAVTKYLPEDERPGLLTLVRIKDVNCQIPVNDRFGGIAISLSDLHLAHIVLPALLALSVGDVKVSQAKHGELVHSVVQLYGSESLPMIMARMLGDEVEPTLKIKLFNTCVEYSVPAVVGLTNLDKEASREEIVADLTQSVADLALHTFHNKPHSNVDSPDLSASPSKKMKIDVLLHDSALGLNPDQLTSKALLVLTNARLSITNPSEQVANVQLELRKAGLFVADEVMSEELESTTTLRASPNNTATKAKLTGALSKRGYVAVGSIMAAKILVCAEQNADDQSNTVDVEVRNELLLLETCADSTQTLIATFNGLVPPTPPSKQPKYHTEPMTIEDMMASFTGEAFEKPRRMPETLFDVEEEPEDDALLALDAPTYAYKGDDLLAESEMTSSLYGPVSGVLQGIDAPDEEEDEFPETVESLLEDDPFEMPLAPAEVGLSDNALLRELNQQAKPTVHSDAIDLGIYEIEDLGFDALASDQGVLSTQYRFNTPSNSRRRAGRFINTTNLPFKVKVRDLHVIWNIYDGYDWQRTREGITHAVEQVELRAEERKARRRQSSHEREDDESVIGDFLFNSIYIGVPSSHDAQELRRQINREIDDLASETESVPMSGMSRPTTVYSSSGRPVRQRQRKRLKLERSRTHKIAFELKGVSADVLVFPPGNEDAVSAVDVRVREFEIFDNVPTSTWRKFLTHLSNEPGDREMAKPMLHVELSNVRTLENFSASEIVMHVSLLPLRLHVDQDALDFITRFFEFKDERAAVASSPGEHPFIQRLEVDTVDLQLDYKPKKVDYAGIRSGHTTEFMNFIILDAANIRLKHAIIYGIRGFEPLHKTLNDIWMPDVKRNQLPTVLAGLAPVRSLVNLGSGVRDVIAIPVREYQKDGRLVRSIQKGAFQFGKTTASELARLGAKVAIGTQTLLQGAEDLLTPVSASPSRPGLVRNRSSDQTWHDIETDEDDHESRAISAYANQPLGVLSGLRSAQRYLEYDLLTARDALIAVQGEIMESAGASSAAAAVVKHAPTIILRPIIGTSRALGTALLGVGNQIDRENVRKIEDKYKHR